MFSHKHTKINKWGEGWVNELHVRNLFTMYICISNHHIVYLKYLTVLLITCTSVKIWLKKYLCVKADILGGVTQTELLLSVVSPWCLSLSWGGECGETQWPAAPQGGGLREVGEGGCPQERTGRKQRTGWPAWPLRAQFSLSFSLEVGIMLGTVSVRWGFAAVSQNDDSKLVIVFLSGTWRVR